MSKLIIIPSPIGNLDDISKRVLDNINSCDLLLVEDTRHTGKLLHLLGIKKRMLSYHMFNEHQNLETYIREIEKSSSVGLMTDAGTPGISDPGFLIIRKCLKHEIEIECLPGPTAFVPALVLSGLSTDRFCFEGFLPVKKGRKTRLDSLKNEVRTMVFYESPHRIGRTLKDLALNFGDERKCSVSREITKKFEETVRGSLKEVSEIINEKKPKGEFVIVIEGESKK